MWARDALSAGPPAAVAFRAGYLRFTHTERNRVGKPVLLLHGWLGKPGAFGALPELLAADGHRVLPVFRSYDSRPRGKRLEDLAEEFDTALRREKVLENLDAPLIVIGHSMGALLARTWMWAHYIRRGEQPPVERLIEAGSPRHGVHLQGVARTFIKLGLVSGTALARQLSAPNPFLWDLAWAETEQPELWPETVSLAGLIGRRTVLTWAAGGDESDGVVPAVFSNPNPVFLKLGEPPRRLQERVFVPFMGYEHSGSQGILRHISMGAGRAASPVSALIRAGGRESPRAVQVREGPGAVEPLKRSVAILRFNPKGSRNRPHLELQDGRTTLRLKPLAEHPGGLALFGWTMGAPGASLRLKFEAGGRAASWTYGDEVNSGLVFYADLRASPAL